MVIYEISGTTFRFNASYEMAMRSSSFGILDSNNNILYCDSKLFSNLMEKEEIGTFLKDSSLNWLMPMENSQEYNAYKINNTKLGLTFVMLASKIDAESNLKSFYRILRGSVAWVAAFFAALCVISAYLSYRPITQLVMRVKNAGGEDDGRIQNEIQTIYSAIEGMNIRNTEMCKMVLVQRALLIESVFSKLIQGVFVEKEEIEQLGLDFSGPYYCAMLIQTPNIKENELQRLVGDIWPKGGVAAHAVEIPYIAREVIICSLPNNSRAIREEFAEKLVLLLEKFGCVNEKIGVGTAVGSLSEVRISYLTATSSFESEQNRRIMFFEDVVETLNSIDCCPSENVLKFIQCIKQGDKANAIKELDNIAGFLNDNIPSMVMRQYVCFNIANTLIKTLIRLGIPLSTEEIGTMMRYDNLESFKRSLSEFVERTCESIYEDGRKKTNKLMRDIVGYVDDNYTKPDISLSSASDKLNLPIYTISRMFKRAAHIGFNEYVTLKRIELSKMQLLISPEKSMKDIALESGFNDVSYFIKIFRKTCGLTPSKFKQL